ncbi:hypothetical protein I3842_05G169600 [Carya illinoinensis]|uniref:DUF4283 domain-containing protein n=1 Tax=Carya illinoinensis TaxID=32201 RepID=A0A922F419_CARIL|nr:hypothetical protein I3842_05G169600 [Carya illinoinensis]
MEEEDLAKRWERLNLSSAESKVFKVRSARSSEGASRSKHYIVGGVLTEKGINSEAFRGWVKFKELGDFKFLIEFQFLGDKEKVLGGRPWFFDRNLVSFLEFDEDVLLNDILFRFEPFWIQLHGLPWGAMTDEVGRQLGSSVGHAIRVDADSDGVAWGKCMRIRVAMDLHKPLLRGKWMELNNLKHWIAIKYERLQSFCFHCGILAHKESETKLKQKVGRNWFFKARQGPYSRVPNCTYGGGPSPESNRDLVQEKINEEVFMPSITGAVTKQRGATWKRKAREVNHPISLVITPKRRGNKRRELISQLDTENKVKKPKGIHELSEFSLSWNCRGLGNPRTVRELNLLVRSKYPDFIFLMETKCGRKRLEEVRNNLQFDYSFVVGSRGLSGGLAFLWKSNVDFSLENYSHNHISMVLTQEEIPQQILVTGFYSFPETSRRGESWNLLRMIKPREDKPWLCLGDFNEIIHHHEKVGAASRPYPQMEAFRMSMDCLGPKDEFNHEETKQMQGVFKALELKPWEKTEGHPRTIKATFEDARLKQGL